MNDSAGKVLAGKRDNVSSSPGPQGGQREVTPAGCPLPSACTHVRARVCGSVRIQTDRWDSWNRNGMSDSHDGRSLPCKKQRQCRYF